MAQEYVRYATDADKLKVYNHRIRLAEEQNRKWHPLAVKWWKRYEAAKRAEAMTQGGHNISGSTPMVIGTIDALYSSMTAAEVAITATAKGNATEDQAYVVGAGLEQEWERTKTPERGDEAVKDDIIVGIGVVKVGYEYVEEEQTVPREEEAVRKEVLALLAEAEAAGEDAPDADTVMGMVPLEEVQTTILSDRIVVDYVPWDMLLLDPTAKRWEDLRWIALKQYMTPEEVKSNALFKEYTASRREGRKLSELKPDSMVERDILGPVADPTKDDERVTVYTLWDLQTGTVCTFQKDAKFLLNETVNPFAMFPDPEDKNPFVPLVTRSTSSRIRGISEMEVLEPVAEEQDLYHSRLGTYLERMAPRYVSRSRAMTPAGKVAMRSQEVGAVVELEEGFDVDALKELNPPRLMSEMYGVPDKLEQSARDSTGVSELMRGLFPDRKRTATETTEVVSASAARQSEKRIKLERFWTNIAKRILWLMQMFYEEERMVRLVDDAGEFTWSFSAADIVGEFQLEVSLTPKEARTWQARSDKALAVLNVVGPMAQPGPDGSAPVDVTELLRYVLTELNIPRRIISKLLNLPEEKQAQMLAQLQAQAAAAQAQSGMAPNPSMVPGPMNADALAAQVNQGTIPPEMLAAARSPGNPLMPGAAEVVSESFSTPRA